MVKHYILDTNVLLYDPNSIKMFEDNNIHIPIVVLEELDKFKSHMGELGVHARQVIQYLDSLVSKGKFTDGIPLDNGGKLFITCPEQIGHNVFDSKYSDNKILQLSYYLRSINGGTRVILVTKDINLRIKAHVLGIEAQDYKNPSEGSETGYSGVGEVHIDDSVLEQFFNVGCIEKPEQYQLYNNQYVIIRYGSEKKEFVLGVFRNNKIYSIKSRHQAVSIKPKNIRQTFAMEALLNPDIQVVSLNGTSGTGKTLLSVAAAIQKTLIENEYDRITITRPVISVGKEIGFLPGSIDEKLDPWMKPIYDAIDLISELDRKKSKSSIPNVNWKEYINIAPLSFIRGRSFINSFMIVDESQNLSPLELKTVITRVGQDTKIVFTGDIYQIDNPYLNKDSNGLSQLIKKFRGKDFYAHVTLTEGERSRVAEEASHLL